MFQLQAVSLSQHIGSGLSQIFTGFVATFGLLSDRTNARAISAGTQPGQRVHPEVVEVMREEGINLVNAKPQFLSEELARQGTSLVIMGCGDACPYVPALKKLDWPLMRATRIS
jgi:arsenate reductase (thioredoxin)